MASTYSTNLAIELIGTGDQAGSWGNTTNTNLGTLIEQAISGYVTQAVSTGTDTTITIPNGATGVARNMYIELTGTGGTNTNLIVPANKKLYFIFNNSTGAVTVKVSGQTGVSVPQGKKVVLTSNGTDIVNGLNYIADFGSNSATITQLTATSATITNLTLTSLVISNLSIASANITTLTSASATITNLLGTTLTISGNSFLATSSGNVGVGTASPVARLDVFKTSSDTISRTNAVGAFGDYVSLGAGLLLQQTLSSPYGFALQAANAANSVQFPLLLNPSGGNVGIGTSSPGAKLTIAQSSNVITQGLLLVNAAGTQNGGWYHGGSALIGRENGVDTIAIAAGNVGIGTTSPAFKLQVIGSTQLAINAAGTQQILQLNNSDTTAGVQTAKLGFSSAGVTKCSIIGAVYGNGYMAFATNDDTEKMRLDASGNLGLGVTPSAWWSGSKAMQLGQGASIEGRTSTNIATFGSNVFVNSAGSAAYINTAFAARYVLVDGTHVWQTAPSGTAGNAITFTQAMTLDASSNLSVATTSTYSAYAKLHVLNGLVTATNATDGGVYIGATTGGTELAYLSMGRSYNLASTGEIALATTGAKAILFGTNNTERMRIDSGGSIKMGGSAAGGTVLGISDGTTDATSYGSVQVTKAADHDNKWHYACVQAGQEIAGMGFQDNVNQMFVVGRGGDPGSTNCIRFAGSDSSMRFLTSGNERARITSGGDFVIGLTSASARLQAAVGAAGSGTLSQLMVGYLGGSENYYDANTHIFRNGSATERARITSGGFLLVGDTTHTDGSIFTATGFTPLNAYRISTTAAQGIFGCYSDTGGTKTVRAYFQVDGGLANYSANDVNLSDQRVKDNINPAGSYWNKIKALEIVTFRYKDQDENDQNIGVIAQQVETVAPEFVSNDGFGETPEGEEPLKTVYTTDMYHAAIKALQEAMARIESLEADVAALKASA